MQFSLEELFPLSPAEFFSFSLDLHTISDPKKLRPLKKYLIPDTTLLNGEENFAQIAMGWNEKGIGIEVEVNQPFSKSLFPDFRSGDSLELFFDTRDVKTAGFLTRFCHHFLFLPSPVEGIQCQEITRFRTEDTHPLCDPQLLKLDAEFHRKHYQMNIFIPAECLHGYDPLSFDRLGFSFRMNRAGAPPQTFPISSQQYAIEQYCSLWCSCKLLRNH